MPTQSVGTAEPPRNPARNEEAATDENSGGDPTDRAQGSNGWCVAFNVVRVAEEQGIRERQSWHVAEQVADQQGVEGPEAGRLGSDEKKDAADDMKDAKHDLSGEVAVGDHPHDEGGDDGRDSGGGVGRSLLSGSGVDRIQEAPHRDVPDAPDEKLNEHHHAEAWLQGGDPKGYIRHGWDEFRHRFIENALGWKEISRFRLEIGLRPVQ